MAERQTVALDVVGSTPTTHPNFPEPVLTTEVTEEHGGQTPRFWFCLFSLCSFVSSVVKLRQARFWLAGVEAPSPVCLDAVLSSLFPICVISVISGKVFGVGFALALDLAKC